MCCHEHIGKEEGGGPPLSLEELLHQGSVRIDHHLKQPKGGPRQCPKQIRNLWRIIPQGVGAHHSDQRNAVYEYDEDQEYGPKQVRDHDAQAFQGENNTDKTALQTNIL